MAQLTQIIGNKVRLLRDRDGLTQDDVARAARAQGLPWGRAVVAHLEAGTKELTAAEYLALPLVFAKAFGELLSLDSITAPDDDEWVDLTDELRIAPDALAELQRGATPASFSAATLDTPQLREDRDALAWLSDPAKAKRAVKRAVTRGKGLKLADELRARHESEGEAEQKAARKLGASPLDVALTANRLWRRGLTAERNARVTELAGPDATPRSVQALRGHITRTLLNELEPALRNED